MRQVFMLFIHWNKEELENLMTSFELDLASFESIRQFSNQFSAHKKEHFPSGRLDSLVLNAGVMLQPFQVTKDNLELTLGTNHFGHFLLTMLLLPTMMVTEENTMAAVLKTICFFLLCSIIKYIIM